VPSPARVTALQVLAAVAEGRATLADALSAPQVEALGPEDRALLHELVLGVLRRRGWLDHVIAGLASRPLRRMAPGVLDGLRLGVYQLLFTRSAPHAAVNEAVDLARATEPRAAGFVNGVLRRLQREGAPAEPDAVKDPRAWLVTYGSLPGWLAERWLERAGAAAAVARARALLQPPSVHLRLNPRVPDAPARLETAGVRVQPGGVPGSLTLLEGRLTPLIEDGVAYAQDEGSQLVAQLAAAEGLVLDACAAPGGKSLLLADLGKGATRVVAAEVSRRRVLSLERLRRRWRAAEVHVVAADALHPPFARPFDAVLLDAPCSGLGTLARHPDIRWRSSAGELRRQSARQRALVESLAPLVRPGGRLVYAVCSTEPEENEEVVTPFLERHPEFEVEELPVWAKEHGNERSRAGPFLTTGPGPVRFFAARLRRSR